MTRHLSDLEVGLGAPPRSTLRDVSYGWWSTSRMEYLPDAVVHVALPLLLVLRHQRLNQELLKLSGAGLFVWLLGHWIGSSINCLADYPTDRLDAGHKSRLAAAIDRAGARSILFVNLVEALGATLAALFFAIKLQRPSLLVFWFAGLLIACLYSIEPVRFKKRNFLNPLALVGIVYSLPLLFVYRLLSHGWDTYDVTVLLVYSCQMIPMFLADEVSDHDEDQATKVNNPCVNYGRIAVCWLAVSIYVMACSASLVLFASQNSSWGLTGLGAIAVASVVYFWVAREFILLLRLSRAILETAGASARAELTQKLKAFSKTPAWLVATGLSVILLTATLVFLNR